MTTVSAILPTYNRAATLARALASVFEQARVPDEVLVVDDGSTDDTAAVVRRFEGARLVRLDRNLGAAGARNEGIRRSSGELIAFLDSDDLWLPAKLERQLAHFAAAPTTQLLCTGITVHERSGRAADHIAAGPSSTAGWSFADFQAYPFCPTTWLIRRDVIEQAGLFDASLRNCEDLDFLARIAGRRIHLLPQVLAIKFNRHDSLDAALERTVESHRTLFSRHRRLWARTPAAAARSHRRLANMHIDAQAMAAARGALLRGLGYRPWDLRSWAMLAASIFGPRGVTALRRLGMRAP